MRITFVTPTVNMSGGIRVVAIYAELLSAMGHSSASYPHLLDRQAAVGIAFLPGWVSPAIAPRNHRPTSTALPIHHHVFDRWRAVTSEDVPDADVVVATWWETAEWVSQFASRKGEKFYFIQGHELFPHLPHERVRATYSLPLKRLSSPTGSDVSWRKNTEKATLTLFPTASTAGCSSLHLERNRHFQQLACSTRSISAV